VTTAAPLFPTYPRRLTPTDVLAREALDAVAVLGPEPVCLDAIERIVRSRPVLVRAAMDLLLDLGRVDVSPGGCFILADRSAA
jgi:hypothetical protein